MSEQVQHTPGPLHLFTNRHPNTDGSAWGELALRSHPAGGAPDSIPGVRCTWSGELGKTNVRLLKAGFESYDKHFGARAVKAAEDDVLGKALELLKESQDSIGGDWRNRRDELLSLTESSNER